MNYEFSIYTYYQFIVERPYVYPLLNKCIVESLDESTSV